jgi:single-stranded-DNA-specific exonuclease
LPSLQPRDPGAAKTLEAAGLPPLLARVYAGRGVTSPEDLDLQLQCLLPPGQLQGTAEAAALLKTALDERWRILVVGDFDADGATSSALAVSVLRELGAEAVDFLVPNRFDYGYGLTPEIVALAALDEPDLLITVDNGISSIEGVRAATAKGMRVLVTDHHLPGAELPDADVIVNPNQPGCGFPSKALAGVGVMFYVLLALRQRLREDGWFEQNGIPEPNLGRHLDLVALGTVADVVPLDRNNRILVQGGLARIRAGGARPGIAALLAVAGRSAADLVAADLGFAVGPRLNAAGRLEDMSIGIDCLLAEDTAGAMSLARRLHALNEDRRGIERGMQEEALALLDRLELTRDPPVALTLYEPGWHQGVIGLLASRIKERLHRPTIAFADAGDGELKGSARSIPGLHIRDALDAVATHHPGLLKKFGGHAMAAGLSLNRSDLDRFRAAFAAEVGRVLDSKALEAVIETDGSLQADEFELDTARQLRAAGPWGQHFPEPVFEGRFRVLSQRIVGERHLKLRLAADSLDLDAIAFNVDIEHWPDPAVTHIRAAYRLDVNVWQGRESLQLVLEYIEAA